MVALHGYSKALSALGVNVELRPANETTDLWRADFVHLWAACSPDWGLPAAQAAKEQGCTLIITPFWWNREERLRFYGDGDDVVPGYTPAVGETLRLADVLFVITMSEAVECWKLAPGVPAHVIGMGFDRPPIEAQEPEDFVLCMGRVEKQKNQHSLAAVCKHLGLPLVLLGGARGPYADMIREHYPEVTFVDHLEGVEKWKLLARARIHACPSFFENPGIVHGEAALLGIPAVMGGHGCEPEFYGQGGIYCDPTDGNDIARAVIEAWNRPRQKWANVPTWEQVASRGLAWLNYVYSKKEQS
jgi:glycosyltransferase involved in cell wall biosynthesis